MALLRGSSNLRTAFEPTDADIVDLIQQQQQPTQAQAPKVVLFGDSISSAVGYGTDSNPDTKFGQNIADVISKQIGVPIESQSMGGVTTQDALTGSAIPYAGKQLAIPYGSYEQYLKDNKPNVVLLRFGAADAIRLNNPQKTIENLKKMVEIAKQYGARPILIGVSPFAPGGDSRAGNINVGSIDPYINSANAINQGIQQIASQNQLPFVDVRNINVPQGALLDGVHPTAAFGKEMALQIGNALSKTFPQYGIQIKRDVVSMLPEDWSSFNEAQKLNWFNKNEVTPQELLNAGVDQKTIDTMSQRGYTGGGVAAPAPDPTSAPAAAPIAAPAAAPAVSPMAGFDASQGVQRIGGMMYQPIFDDNGVLQEVLRYQEGQTGAGQSYERLDPTTLQPTGTGQFQKTGGLGKMLKTAVEDLGPLAMAAISVNPALAASIGTAVANAVGVETLTASQAASLGKTVASTAMQAVTTGKINVEDALRSAAVTAFAPSLGKTVSDAVADTFYNATGVDLPDAVVRSVNNAAASAAATAIQQGADSADIARNALAGAISSGVTSALNEARVDPSLALSIGRTTGSYISTGDLAQSVMDGVTRGISYEQQKAEADKAKEVRAAYRDPSRALDVLQPDQAADVASPVAEDVQNGGAPADQQVQITGQTNAPTLDQQVLDVIRGSQTTDQAATQTQPPSAVDQQVQITGAEAPTGIDQDVLSAIKDQQPTAAPTQPPAAPASQTQQVQITGQAPKPVEQEPFAAVTAPAQTPQAPVAAPAAPTEPSAPSAAPTPSLQTVEVSGTRLPEQDILDLIQQQLGTAVEQPTTPAVAPSQATATPVAAPDQKIEVTGTALPPAVQDVVSDVVTPTPAPPPDQTIDITAGKDQTYTLTGSPITDQDVIAAMTQPTQTVEVTAPRDQTSTATGTPVQTEDVVSTVPPDQTIEITAPKDKLPSLAGPVLTDQDIIAAIQGQPDQTIDVTGTKDQSYTVTGTPTTEEDVISAVPPDQRIDITGTKDQKYTVTGTPLTEEDVVSTVPDQTIDITGNKDQTYDVTGTPVTEEDVISTVPPADQTIDITGTKEQTYPVTAPPVSEEDVVSGVPPTDQTADVTAPLEQPTDVTTPPDQTLTVTGEQPVSDRDLLDYVADLGPTPEPPPAEPPSPTPPEPPAAKDTKPETPYPTELFKFINRGRRDVSPVLTQALSAKPGRVGLSYARPAGEIESEVTGKKRRDVWNEASLRLKDALGL